jgi:hypothetical protein
LHVHFHGDGVRLCLWTVATNGPIHHPGDTWVWRAMVKWYCHGKVEELWEKHVLLPLLTATNFTFDLGTNPDLHSERPTNHLEPWHGQHN